MKLYSGNYVGSNTYCNTNTYLTYNYDINIGKNNNHSYKSINLGRAGTAEIDLLTGKLLLTNTYLSWAGNRLPITVSHIFNGEICDVNYTSNSRILTSNFSGMDLGKGWKLNLMQSMISYNGKFIYAAEDGKQSYFEQDSEDSDLYTNENGDKYYVSEKNLISGDRKLSFDDSGRLIRIGRIVNNIEPAVQNAQNFTYTNNKLTQATDGIGRIFTFTYDQTGKLTQITGPDSSLIKFKLTDNRLTITYPDNVQSIYSIENGNIISVKNAEISSNNAVTVLNSFNFEYNALGRVQSIKSYEGDCANLGQSADLTYDTNNYTTHLIYMTHDQDNNSEQNDVYYCFTESGSLISSYFERNGIKYGLSSPNFDGINSFIENAPTILPNVNNLLLDNNFEFNTNSWKKYSGSTYSSTISESVESKTAFYGTRIQKFVCSSATESGIYQTVTLPAGYYTLSAYINIDPSLEVDFTSKGAFLSVVNSSNTVLCRSDYKSLQGIERLFCSFTLASASTVKIKIGGNFSGNIIADAAQLENSDTVNDYNILNNGNFEDGQSSWQTGTDQALSVYPSVFSILTTDKFNMTKSLKITGGTSSFVYQSAAVNKFIDVKETFTLSGWAKSENVVKNENGKFELRAEIIYKAENNEAAESETFSAEFAYSANVWQFASVSFAKSRFKEIDKLIIYIDFSENGGSVYFDAIQLTRTNKDEGLTADDFAIIEEAPDNAQFSVESDDDTTAEDNSDIYGNTLYNVTNTQGEYGSLYQSYAYTANGNNLASETDNRNYATTYTYDEDTSLLISKTASGQSTLNYAYNLNKQLIAISVGNEKYVDYSYDSFNNLSSVTSNGLTYNIDYNVFGKLNSIGINGSSNSLISYSYNNNGNGRINGTSYGNAMSMSCKYNSLGRMISETWKDNSNNVQACYEYIYDINGNIIRSIDKNNQIMYTYLYENGKIDKANEFDIVYDSNGNITNRTLKNSFVYSYDSKGNLKYRNNIFANSEQTYKYEYTDDDESNYVLVLPGGAKSSDKTDHLGRTEFKELNLNGQGFISRKYSYIKGVCNSTFLNGKLKSVPATSLVGSIEYDDGSTLEYAYDAAGNISCVRQEGALLQAYTYDGLNRLATEQNVRNKIYTHYNYDKDGNILSKIVYNCNKTTVSDGTDLSVRETVTYIYDNVWKDKLTSFNGTSITYDSIGNPLIYKGNALTWEKGRQLKSFGTNTYKYNASGIRISKTVAGTEHKYVLDGTNIIRETYGDVTLDYLYDKDNDVCGFSCNGTPYYYYKNLQGDVTAIANSSGTVLANYYYDAWGKVEISGNTVIANINPFRYRSYYYDSETGLYYLNSRYYDPETCRFINADDPNILLLAHDINNSNLFVYCNNNPIMNEDFYGNAAAAITMGLLSSLAGQYVGLSVSIKAFITQFWNIFIVVGLAVIIALLIYAITKTAQKVIERVKVELNENRTKEIKKYNQQLVYVLMKDNFSMSNIFYVGRTKNGAARYAYHSAHKPFKFLMQIVHFCNNLTEARVWEQAVLSACLVQKFFEMGMGFSNKIRGISVRNLHKFKSEISDIASLLTCTSESNLLNMMRI